MDEVKSADSEINEELRRIYDEGRELMERDRKNFKSGSEDRQRKVEMSLFLRFRSLNLICKLLLNTVHEYQTEGVPRGDEASTGTRI